MIPPEPMKYNIDEQRKMVLVGTEIQLKNRSFSLSFEDMENLYGQLLTNSQLTSKERGVVYLIARDELIDRGLINPDK